MFSEKIGLARSKIKSNKRKLKYALKPIFINVILEYNQASKQHIFFKPCIIRSITPKTLTELTSSNVIIMKINGGDEGTRTLDLLRDRQAF